MLASTEGNSTSALTLGSQGCLSTSWPSCSPLDRDAVASTGLLPQSGRDKWRLRGFGQPTHPDTMRLAPRVAAAVPASVAQPEPAVVSWIGPPDRRTLRAPWLTKGSRKEKATNSVLETSQSILLRRGPSANTALHRR